MYLAPHDSFLSPEDREALETHLAACESCRQDFQESQEAIALLQEHWELSEDTQLLLERTQPQGPTAGASRVIWFSARLRRTVAGATVAAACLVFAVLGWRVVSDGGVSGVGCGDRAASSETSLVIESTGRSARISPGVAIHTRAGEMRDLVLNGKHKVVMNASTRLSVTPLVDTDGKGCMINLAWGEVYVHVEHDGRPFQVRTTHARAVITGTTFDMKVTEAGTTLMVVEGSVRFESEGGAAQVSASQQSTIAGTLPPSTPTACEAVAMTAWAGVNRNTSQIAQEIGREDLSLDDLVLFQSPDTQTDLKSTNYAPWVERNRKWFQQQFPDIFRLREALTQEDVAVDYPDLLLASTAVWQFAYPPARPSRLSGIEEAALRKAARRYGKDLQWLRSKGLLPVARAVTDEQRQMREAFSLWRSKLAAALDDGKEVPQQLVLDSLHAGVYLRQTRSLIWLAVEADRYLLPSRSKAQLQALLQAEVAATDSAVSGVIRLLSVNKPILPCDSDLYRHLVQKLCDGIVQISQTEERLADELAGLDP